MPVSVTIRPNGARTEVRGMPWTGRPGNTYAVLEEAIDASRQGQVQYSRQGRFFSVARSHTHALITFLAERYGHVHVVWRSRCDRGPRRVADSLRVVPPCLRSRHAALRGLCDQP